MRAITGSTPARMIRRVKALEAKRLLGRTSLTVAQVATQLGFDDPAYTGAVAPRLTTRGGEFRRLSLFFPAGGTRRC